MRRGTFAVALGAISVALLSCQIILGIDEPVGTARPAPDSGPPIPDECRHAVMEGAPNVRDDEINIFGNNGLWFATTSYDVPYVDDAGLGRRGLDLDNACTCNPDPDQRDSLDGAPRCAPRYGSTVTPQACDGPGGVDDAFGQAVETYFSAVPAGDPRAAGNEDIQHGISTALIWLTGYNGLLDDSAVQVAIVPSAGVQTASRCQGQPERDASDRIQVGDASFYPPLFDGCDPWAPRMADVQTDEKGAQPRTINQAFVKGGILYSRWLSDSIPISFLGATMTASDAHLTARLTKVSDSSYRLDGFVAGRLSVDQLLHTIGGTMVRVSGGQNTPLCTQSGFSYLSHKLCEQLDVIDNPNVDPAGTVCNAVSVVVGVHAMSTIVGAAAAEQVDVFADCTALGIATACPP